MGTANTTKKEMQTGVTSFCGKIVNFNLTEPIKVTLSLQETQIRGKVNICSSY